MKAQVKKLRKSIERQLKTDDQAGFFGVATDLFTKLSTGPSKSWTKLVEMQDFGAKTDPNQTTLAFFEENARGCP